MSSSSDIFSHNLPQALRQNPPAQQQPLHPLHPLQTSPSQPRPQPQFQTSRQISPVQQHSSHQQSSQSQPQASRQNSSPQQHSPVQFSYYQPSQSQSQPQPQPPRNNSTPQPPRNNSTTMITSPTTSSSLNTLTPAALHPRARRTPVVVYAAESSKLLSQLFTCCVCQDIYTDPVMLNSSCSHTFCRNCIKNWLASEATRNAAIAAAAGGSAAPNSRTCPMCRAAIDSAISPAAVQMLALAAMPRPGHRQRIESLPPVMRAATSPVGNTVNKEPFSPAMIVNDYMDELKVHCPYGIVLKGTSKQERYTYKKADDMTTKVGVMDEDFVPMPGGCTVILPRREMLAHEQICDYAWAICTHCHGFEAPRAWHPFHNCRAAPRPVSPPPSEPIIPDPLVSKVYNRIRQDPNVNRDVVRSVLMDLEYPLHKHYGRNKRIPQLTYRLMHHQLLVNVRSPDLQEIDYGELFEFLRTIADTWRRASNPSTREDYEMAALFATCNAMTVFTQKQRAFFQDMINSVLNPKNLHNNS